MQFSGVLPKLPYEKFFGKYNLHLISKHGRAGLQFAENKADTGSALDDIAVVSIIGPRGNLGLVIFDPQR